MIRSPLVAAMLVVLAACGQEQSAQPPVDPALADPAGEGLGQAKPAAQAVAALDKARLANPCLLEAKAVGDALGFAVEKAQPETLGDNFGCSYRGAKGMLRLNMMWSDPVYFDKASATLKAASPGSKRDLPGDPDKAWIQDYPPNLPVLHYYQQNVLVELVPLIESGGDAKAVEAALLKLPRVP